MPVISVFGGGYCGAEAVARELLEGRSEPLRDGDVVAEASRISGMTEQKIERAFSGRTSVFNKFTHERERAIVHLRLAMARMLGREDLLIFGFCGMLLPARIEHVLKVCLIADLGFRVTTAAQEKGVSEKEALRIIRGQDEDAAAWVGTLHQKADPWDPALYDLVVPMHSRSPADAARLIRENALKEVVQPTERSRRAVRDFLLSAEVGAALAKEGHNVDVETEGGSVTLTINKHVLMLGRLEEELKSIAQALPGVESVQTKVGRQFHRADIYRKHDFQAPSKVLLVDDEREFAQTLSERLIIRDVGSAIAYDGESALNLIQEDEPEVIILDLKMPGIDGMEVLRRVKETRPDIEVIMLTGHGSEIDMEACLKLGAFAYLQKPLDIELLSETIKKANEKIRKARMTESCETRTGRDG